MPVFYSRYCEAWESPSRCYGELYQRLDQRMEQDAAVVLALANIFQPMRALDRPGESVSYACKFNKLSEWIVGARELLKSDGIAVLDGALPEAYALGTGPRVWKKRR